MDDQFVIWSIEHNAWWGPGSRGYTRVLTEAGRYGRTEAATIVTRANLVKVNECMIPTTAVGRAIADGIQAALDEDGEPAGDERLTDDDKALRIAIMAATETDVVAVDELVYEYYRDADRADRTSRSAIYLHLGILLGVVQRERSLRRASES